MASINPSAKIISCTRGRVPDPLALVASADGKGAAQLAFLDEHRNLLKAADEDNKLDDDHHHDHVHATSCTDEHCTDPSHHHDHSHDHDHHHGHEACTHHGDSDHSHSHDHVHSPSCTVSGCNDPTHDHDHSHSHSHNHEETTAQKRFGISSFVYRRRVPFHPIRFSRFLNSLGRLSVSGMSGLTVTGDLDGSDPSLVSARRALMRSKGFIWMSTSKSAAYFMSHAGQYLELNVLGRWWADIPKEEWPQGLDQDIRTDFDGPDGDRRQELVFIGQFGKEGGKSKQALEEALDACLLTNEEMAKYKELAPKGDNALVDYFAP